MASLSEARRAQPTGSHTRPTATTRSSSSAGHANRVGRRSSPGTSSAYRLSSDSAGRTMYRHSRSSRLRSCASIRTGKGDHRHVGDEESDDAFTTPGELLAAFERDIARRNREDSDA
jgi:hypothetical protein